MTDNSKSEKKTLSQGDYQYAMRLMRAIGKRVRKEINTLRPDYEYVMVDSISGGSDTVRVYYPDDPDNTFSVQAHGKLPFQTGQIVRIAGRSGDRHVDGVAGGAMAATAPGFIQWTAGTTPPPGWLVADGSPFDPSQYAFLATAIGFNFGTDGVTGFPLLPNLIGNFPRGSSGVGGTGGSSTHTHTTPNHTHSLSDNGGAGYWAAGALAYMRRITRSFVYNTTFTIGGGAAPSGTQTGAIGLVGNTDSDGASTTGASSTLPPYLNLLPLIKY